MRTRRGGKHAGRADDAKSETTAATAADTASAEVARRSTEAPQVPAETSSAHELDDPYEGERSADDSDHVGTDPSIRPRRSFSMARAFAYGVLPALALVLAMGAGFLKWQDSSVRNDDLAESESVQTAKSATVQLLSYSPDTVDRDLGSASDLLTGEFKNSYTSLIADVVIPGARQKHISAVATVPAAASLSANPNHAVALVFVNQTLTVGADAPSDTASSVKVTMDKVGGHWLVSGFDPV